jgi:protein TonB
MVRAPMYHADLSSSRPVRIRAFAAVTALHLGLLLVLLRAFAPQFTSQAGEQVVAAFTIAPATKPSPPAEKRGHDEQAGAAAESGRKAVPQVMSAPRPRIALPQRSPAPPIPANGSAQTSGSSNVGQGSGAGGQGVGTGSGTAGNGSGAGTGTPSAKLSGDINSARDYPRETRDLRIDDYVVIYLTVGTDGRAHDCRIARPSKDDAANQITCKLAIKRFRFRPATDDAGNPVVSTFGWQQKWFY